MHDDFVPKDTSIKAFNPNFLEATQIVIALDEEEDQDEDTISEEDDGYERLGNTNEYDSDHERERRLRLNTDPYTDSDSDEDTQPEIQPAMIEEELRTTLDNQLNQFLGFAHNSEDILEPAGVRDIAINADEILNIMANMNDLQERMTDILQPTNNESDDNDRSLL